MSARPRPVTATFKPACMDAPIGQTPSRCYSLSSNGSTNSLISVLDHESCEEIEPDSDDEQQKKEEEDRIRRQKEQRRKEYAQATALKGVNVPRKRKGETFKRNSMKSLHVEMTESEENTEPKTSSTPSGLSPWEEWMIRKAQEDRKTLEAEVKKKNEEKKKIQLKEQEKAEKKVKEAEKINEWMEKISIREKTRKKLEKQAQKAKEELEREKKRSIEEKSEEKFENWKKDKAKKESEKKKGEKEKKKKEEEEKRKLEEKCKLAYDDWLKKSKARPKSSATCNSFGYTSGKLTGYHDSGAYPVPQYCNPIPWQPIQIPKEKPVKRQRPKSTYKFNPNKYL